MPCAPAPKGEPMIRPAGLRAPDHWQRAAERPLNAFPLAYASARRRMTGETRKMPTDRPSSQGIDSFGKYSDQQLKKAFRLSVRGSLHHPRSPSCIRSRGACSRSSARCQTGRWRKLDRLSPIMTRVSGSREGALKAAGPAVRGSRNSRLQCDRKVVCQARRADRGRLTVDLRIGGKVPT